MMNERDTIELDEAQRMMAEELLDRVNEGDIEHPKDFVDEWISVEKHYDYREILHHVFENVEGEIPRKHVHIPLAEIAGTTDSDPDVPLSENRLRKILNWLLSGEFQIEHERPPKLEKIGDKYYVSMDGNHRVTLFKALDIETIYVEYIETPLPK